MRGENINHLQAKFVILAGLVGCLLLSGVRQAARADINRYPVVVGYYPYYARQFFHLERLKYFSTDYIISISSVKRPDRQK